MFGGESLLAALDWLDFTILLTLLFSRSVQKANIARRFENSTEGTEQSNHEMLNLLRPILRRASLV